MQNILFLLIGLFTIFGCTKESTDYTPDKNLPDLIDLRSEGNFTPVKNQMDLGSCWAFACVGLTEYLIKRDFGIEVDLSEQHLVNCAGFGPLDGMNYLVEQGVVPEDELPYQNQVLDCNQSLDGIYKLQSYEMIDLSSLSSEQRINSLQTILANQGPFVTHLDLYDDLGSYSSGVYEYNGTANSAGGHIVLVVGYYDDENIKNGGYWIAKNSWGPEWGEEGYFRIPYEECNMAVYYAYTANVAFKVGNVIKCNQIPEGGYHCRWSHDGTKLAYTRRYPTSVGVWVYDFINHTEEHVVTDMEGDMQLSWLDDGQQIVFDAYNSSQRLNLWTIDVTTKEKSLLVQHGLIPDAHPTQDKLVCCKDGNLNLYHKNGLHIRTIENINGFSAAISPDGEKIVLVSEESGNEDIWTINLDGTNKKQITTHSGRDYWPRWSPNGKWIAFESHMSGNADVWLYNIESENFIQLTDDPGRDGMGDWSPDGKSIVFISERDGNWGIYLYEDII